MKEEIVLTKDLKAAAETLDRNQIRFIVDNYVVAQKRRIREDNQSTQQEKANEPHALLDHFAGISGKIEDEMRKVMRLYAENDPVGRWSMQWRGIGEVVSAGLLAYIDIEKAPTVGHIWAFAGYDPTRKWGKGEKRPHCAALKRLCWLCGQCLMKVQMAKLDEPISFYARIYRERKAYEQAKNEKGEYAGQAAEVLLARPTHAQKAIYKTGKLPPGHIDARARRYAVKLFLSHWHDFAYRQRFNEAPPKPYPLVHMGHIHEISAPKVMAG